MTSLYTSINSEKYEQSSETHLWSVIVAIVSLVFRDNTTRISQMLENVMITNTLPASDRYPEHFLVPIKLAKNAVYFGLYCRGL